MGTKKKNTNKIPLKKGSVDVKQIISEATCRMNLRAWALVLGSFANFSEATTENMLKLWHDVNAYGSTISSYQDIKDEMEYIEKTTGIRVDFKQLSSANITTQGDLKRFTRNVEKNALSSGLAIIAEPIIREEMLSEDNIRALFRRVLLNNEEIEDKTLKVSDLQQILEDEFNLCLYERAGTVMLGEITQKACTNTE